MPLLDGGTMIRGVANTRLFSRRSSGVKQNVSVPVFQISEGIWVTLAAKVLENGPQKDEV
jgi:flagella basal body P-ring formation protein FlgA